MNLRVLSRKPLTAVCLLLESKDAGENIAISFLAIRFDS
ncbi:hypothetical protein SynBMKMC1_01134 [Synechococcus sp. BMK-MC-1]|nr:hypothetical protein SynBMKMC1_01134 [Synechococcus sp. BMK-MC-1]